MHIVYESSTGFTKRYAEMFAEKTGLECCSLQMAKFKAEKHEDIIFFGWVQQGEIHRLKKAEKKYNVLAVCPVGISEPSEKVLDALKEKNALDDDSSPKMFYLRGGYNREESVGLQGALINMLVKEMENNTDKLDATELTMLNDLKNGADYVSEENLNALYNWYKSI